MTVKPLNPEGMLRSPAFSQAIVTEGPGKTIYIGGQNAVNEKGETVGGNDFKAQTEQVMKNIATVLAAAGTTFDNVIKLTICAVQGNDLRAGFEAAQPFMSKTAPPPVVTVLVVAALGHPDYLVEIDAIAYM
ncbi:RidA family protein [Chitinophaga sp. GCM10012297]|uniref:RidA family protein n=1 Tax=Chitinophaga chungangae TaxID=2821488 RepID=A0ABS3YHI2_9BACT|nr:RidA family protein [Chitinophaga chungangae]MBO9154145.1 RidA family protein [Chitinophaga chungangae]